MTSRRMASEQRNEWLHERLAFLHRFVAAERLLESQQPGTGRQRKCARLAQELLDMIHEDLGEPPWSMREGSIYD